MVGGKSPERLLLLSAEMGGGHTAAAAALAEAAQRLWPQCQIQHVDTIGLWGRGFARWCRSAYRLQIERAPFVYQFFYDALLRHPLFARASKRLTGSFFGHRLNRVIRRFGPDHIISTYPLASSALHWLRRTRGLDATTATFVTDFAVHPFWVYSGIDVHLVLHEASVPVVSAFGARGTAFTAAPPVRDAFRPTDSADARRRLGLGGNAFLVLLTGGEWGAGAMEEAARALMAGSLPVQVVAVCGQNKDLRTRLEALGLSPDRLLVLGYVETMPDLMAAANVVVTNGGGITPLEALASGRTMIVFDPLAGHGRAAATLMGRVGLTLVCTEADELVESVRRIAAHDLLVARLRATQIAYLSGKDIRADLLKVAATPRPMMAKWPWRVRTAVRAVAAGAVAFLVLVQVSFMAGTHLARAARGAPAESREVAIAVTGSLSGDLIRALSNTASQEAIPLTIFVQGRDAATVTAAASELPTGAIEFETGMWQACRDNVLEPGDTRREFARSVAAVASAVQVVPRYVAEPCGGFSLGAVAVTGHLQLRRVVFARRVVVSRESTSILREVPSGGIIEVQILPGTSLSQAIDAIRTVATIARQEGLRLETVAQIDDRGGAHPSSADLVALP